MHVCCIVHLCVSACTCIHFCVCLFTDTVYIGTHLLPPPVSLYMSAFLLLCPSVCLAVRCGRVHVHVVCVYYRAAGALPSRGMARPVHRRPRSLSAGSRRTRAPRWSNKSSTTTLHSSKSEVRFPCCWAVPASPPHAFHHASFVEACHPQACPSERHEAIPPFAVEPWAMIAIAV